MLKQFFNETEISTNAITFLTFRYLANSIFSEITAALSYNLVECNYSITLMSVDGKKIAKQLKNGLFVEYLQVKYQTYTNI